MAGIQIDGVNNKIDFDDDQDTSISSASDDTLVVEVGGNTLATVTATSLTINDGVTITTADNTDQLTLVSTDADAEAGPQLVLHRESGSPADNDVIGRVRFEGEDDASNKTVYAQFTSQIIDAGDGSGGSEDSTFQLEVFNNGALRRIFDISGGTSGQGEIVFNQPNQDMNFVIESSGLSNAFVVDAGNDVAGFCNVGSTDQQLIVENQASASGRTGFTITNPSSSAAMNGQEIKCVRSNSSAYSFFLCRSSSSGTPDTEFNVRGDGEVFADGGTAMNTPADYAEMFEWKDGNADSEVRFGYSVILDGDKIVKASDSDDASKIIGVVSAKPAVLGDAAWSKWSQKYLKDEWNQYILEEYTSTEWVEVKDRDNIKHSYETDKIPSDVTVPSDAKVITKDKDNNLLTRRKLNPEWDSSKTYIPRQERKEWNAVGLMGKLRLRKGQPTGTNWIKMRDISDSVEEWLVR